MGTVAKRRIIGSRVDVGAIVERLVVLGYRGDAVLRVADALRAATSDDEVAHDMRVLRARLRRAHRAPVRWVAGGEGAA